MVHMVSANPGYPQQVDLGDLRAQSGYQEELGRLEGDSSGVGDGEA